MCNHGVHWTRAFSAAWLGHNWRHEQGKPLRIPGVLKHSLFPLLPLPCTRRPVDALDTWLVLANKGSNQSAL